MEYFVFNIFFVGNTVTSAVERGVRAGVARPCFFVPFPKHLFDISLWHPLRSWVGFSFFFVPILTRLEKKTVYSREKMTTPPPSAYQRGYDDVLKYGPMYVRLDMMKEPAYTDGFRAGVFTLHQALTPSVLHMIGLVTMHAQLQIDADIRLTTPPLNAFSRRTLYLLLGKHQTVKTVLHGKRTDKERRIAIHYCTHAHRSQHRLHAGQSSTLETNVSLE
jgi:hypothetical protein